MEYTTQERQDTLAYINDLQISELDYSYKDRDIKLVTDIHLLRCELELEYTTENHLKLMRMLAEHRELQEEIACATASLDFKVEQLTRQIAETEAKTAALDFKIEANNRRIAETEAQTRLIQYLADGGTDPDEMIRILS